MRNHHAALFKAQTLTFPPDLIEEWQTMVTKWQLDPNEPDPFEEPVIGKKLHPSILNDQI